MDNQSSKKNYEFTDVGNAVRFYEKYKDKLMYVPETAGWYEFQGNCWDLDTLKNVVSHAIEVTRDMLREAADIQREAARHTEPRDVKAMIADSNQLARHAYKSQSKASINAMIKLSEPMLSVSRADLDTNDLLLAVRNGVINLCTSEFRNGRRDDMITQYANTDWTGGDAPHKRWDEFMEKVLPDREIRHWMHKYVGYCLTGRCDEQIIVILQGDGANGKSVFAEVVKSVLGTYAKTVQFETFSSTNKSSTRNDLAGLDKTRLVIAQEGDSGTRLDEGLVKQLTGGDQVSARYLYREFFTYTPKYKIVLATNHRPQIIGTDHGIWRRIVLVPWTVTIPDDQQDSSLKFKLLQESSGILAWAVRGAQLWLQEGLKQKPNAVYVASQDYQDEQDLVGQWIKESCVFNEQAKTSSAVLYESYRIWSEMNGCLPLSKRTLGDRFRSRGLNQGRVDNGRGWCGIELKEES